MWTLHVENFGRIEKADIEVSPLTLFVGDNNSGKSYLLSLIYGLMCADDVLADLCEDSPEYQACAEWTMPLIEKIMRTGKTEQPFDDAAYTIFENLWNRILQDNQRAIIQSIFHQNIFAKKVSVTFQRQKIKKFHFFKMKPMKTTRSTGNRVHMDFPNGTRIMFHLPYRGDRMSKSVLKDASRIMSPPLISEALQFVITPTKYNLSFLPTSRTGFLLTYPALAKDAFSRAYGSTQKQNVDLSLSKPFTDFLSNLTTINKQNVSDKYQPIIGFMERNIIHGKILVSNDLPLPEFHYKPDNMETSLPMYLSSDVIKELAPLILMLQYQNVDALFIEEPEMSLHPKLQQTMARTLIKLVNAGTPVLAATHSDTILQHVNNMVKLNNLPKARKQTLMKRFGFDADDPISADKISVYQFDVQDNGKTIVRALTHGDYGFEVPTFYDPLEKLLEQTQATELGAEEYED